MKKTVAVSLIIALFAVVLSGCKIRDAKAGPDKLVRMCKNSNELFTTTYSKLKIPDNLRQFAPVKSPEDFNVGKFILSLTTLEVNEGFLVDYVYQYRGIGAQPLLYSLPISQKPFTNEKEFETGKPLDFTYGIETDGTELGFLQLAMFNALGPNFYLYWHAGINDDVVLCDIDDVEAVLDNLDQMEFGKKPDLLQKARALTIPDIEPKVKFIEKDRQVKVSMLMFTKWGGFFRRTYTFEQGFPHKILDMIDTPLINYDCGIKF
jgi:hypothetical protein